MTTSFPFKRYLYYLIETEDEFIRNNTTKLFGNPSQRLINIVGGDIRTCVVFRSIVDKICYKVSIDDFVNIVDIKDRFEINPN